MSACALPRKAGIARLIVTSCLDYLLKSGACGMRIRLQKAGTIELSMDTGEVLPAGRWPNLKIEYLRGGTKGLPDGTADV